MDADDSYTLVGMLSGLGVISLVTAFGREVHPWQESLAISGYVLGDLLFIGVFGTVGGYLLWISGVTQLGAANASLFFNFVPVFAALTAFAYGQSVTQLQLLGVAIVIAGLLLPGWLNGSNNVLSAKKPRQFVKLALGHHSDSMLFKHHSARCKTAYFFARRFVCPSCRKSCRCAGLLRDVLCV